MQKTGERCLAIYNYIVFNPWYKTSQLINIMIFCCHRSTQAHKLLVGSLLTSVLIFIQQDVPRAADRIYFSYLDIFCHLFL